MSEKNELVRIYKFTMDYYDLDEIRTLCFNLGVIYDDLSGDRISSKVRELLIRLGHDRRFDELLDELETMRPIRFEKAKFKKDETYFELLYSALPTFVEITHTSNLKQQESTVFTLLTAALIVVWLGYGCSFLTEQPIVFLFPLSIICFPATFVPISIVGLLTGFRLNSRRIKVFSIALGSSAGIVYLALFIIRVFGVAVGSTIQLFGLEEEFLNLIYSIPGMPTPTPTPFR
jgi:hypothetical protein